MWRRDEHHGYNSVSMWQKNYKLLQNRRELMWTEIVMKILRVKGLHYKSL